MPTAHNNNITAIIAVAKRTINGMLYTANINFKTKDKIVTINPFIKNNYYLVFLIKLSMFLISTIGCFIII